MATTTNYGWSTPDDTSLVKDGAAAIRTLGSSVDTTTKALNPSTTLGDIEYRSATANTNTRLGIGSTGNVLTVNGGVPTWAPPAGGAGNIVQIATGTLSGASVSITGLSSYTDLYLMVSDVLNNTASGRMYFRINGNTGSNYVQTTTTLPQTGNYTYYGNYTDTQAWLAGTNANDRTTVSNAFYVALHNCKNAGFTNYESHSGYFTSPGATNQVEITGGVYKVSESVSSISFYNVGGTFSAGTYTLWGA